MEEIERKEKLQNDSFKKWMSSGEFRFLHTRNRAELEDYIRGCFREMADLQAEILRLKQM
jgi:2-polyprenyl-3-methyl-5-hydroxy-6-metoxy-1,4-benzoquinol methylase